MILELRDVVVEVEESGHGDLDLVVRQVGERCLQQVSNIRLQSSEL